MSEAETKKLVPAIRFDGFDGAWRDANMGQLVDVKSGRDYKHLGNGNIPVYGTGGYMLSVDEALSDNCDAVGIGRKGTIDKPYILNAPFWTVDTLFYCIPNSGNELNFVFSVFQRINWKQLDESTGVPSLSKVAIDDLSLKAPKPDEQTKIGEYFQQLDALIAGHRGKREKLQQLKKSLLEKMFPKQGQDKPEIRFAGFDGDWNCTEFEKLVSRVGNACKDSLLPRVEYEDIVAGRGLLNKDLDKKESAKVGIEFQIGDVLYGKLRPYLKNWLLPEFNGVAVGDFWVLRTNKYNAELIFYLVQTDSFDKVANQSTGSKMPRADWRLVSKSRFSVPKDPQEQTKIGTLFKHADTLITQHQNQIDKLNNIKQACLAQMFV